MLKNIVAGGLQGSSQWGGCGLGLGAGLGVGLGLGLDLGLGLGHGLGLGPGLGLSVVMGMGISMGLCGERCHFWNKETSHRLVQLFFTLVVDANYK